MREYRPIYCVVDSVLKPQDTSLSGGGGHRHDDYRKLAWEVDVCQGNSQVTCSQDSAADLAFLRKMELVLLYNTERFNPQSRSQDDLIIEESTVSYFEFDPTKRYKLTSTAHRGQVIEESSLFARGTTDFFTFEAGDLLESSTSQQAYLSGEISLSLDRTVITRKMYSVFDVLAAVGGFGLALFVLLYAAVAFYVQMEQKMFTVMNLFYFSAKFEEKMLHQPTEYKVKAELGGRYRVERPSLLELISCKAGPFFEKINKGHEKLKMRLDLAKFLEE